MTEGGILAIDIGGGTQDIFLYEPGQPVENCVQLILPSPTVMVAREIASATARRRHIFLHGYLMGGGACTGALRRHLAEGLKAYATPEAAKTFHDNLDKVRDLGVVITERAPQEAVPIRTGDLDLAKLAGALKPYGVSLPDCVAVAVQDHGEAPGMSNREFRFRHWRRFIEKGGRLSDLVYREVPSYLTRMRAVQKIKPGAILMDTGAAAVWGALCDPVAAAHRQEGIIVVNIGNQHTVSVLVKGDRVWGLFEHHTRVMSTEKLADYVAKLRDGTLTHEEVFADRGHGCHIHSDYSPNSGAFEQVVVTGPQRHLAAELGYHFAAPYGDMMLSGCFGLVAAVKNDTAL